MMRNFLIVGATIGLLACGEEATTEVAPKVTCDLSLDKLADSEWLFLQEINGMDPEPDLKSRLKFVEADGKLTAKYTAASLSDMYDYECGETDKSDQIVCRTKPDIVQWCQTLMTNNRKCNIKTLKGLDDTLVESEELTKSIEAATKIFQEAKKSEQFQGYKSQFNTLANKLQGLVYVSVDSNKCRLNVIDHYMAYANKQRVEDSNPNGNNPFVKNEVGELQWEDCETSQLFDTLSADFPEKPEEIQPIGRHAVGSEVHYWVLHGPLRFEEEGCEYSFDVFYNYRKIREGLKPEVVEVDGKKENRFHYAKTFKNASKRGQPEILMTTHSIKCADKPEKKITTCNKVFIK
jgi:hypothetical protein